MVQAIIAGSASVALCVQIKESDMSEIVKSVAEVAQPAVN
jgi:hypothetical protein